MFIGSGILVEGLQNIPNRSLSDIAQNLSRWIRFIHLLCSSKCYSTSQSVNHNVEPVHMYIGSSCHTPLAQRNEAVRSNPRKVEIVTVSVTSTFLFSHLNFFLSKRIFPDYISVSVEISSSFFLILLSSLVVVT